MPDHSSQKRGHAQPALQTVTRSPRVCYISSQALLMTDYSTAIFGLINSDVFKDFPDLKIVVSHGGGAMPYQLGRFQAGSMRRPEGDRFIDGMHKLYFDTVLYTKDAIELLLKVVGAAPLQADFGIKTTYDDKLWFGIGYRNNGEMAALLGYSIQERYIIGYSYDIPSSDMSDYSGGSHEFMIGIRFLAADESEIMR